MQTTTPMKWIRGLTLCLVLASSASAQVPRYQDSEEVVGLNVNSGLLVGSAGQTHLGFEHTVHVQGARWLWLDLTGTRLGVGSYLTILAEEDAAYQVLDRFSLAEWYDRSAYFNGDTVVVQLWIAAQDTGSELSLMHAGAGIDTPRNVQFLLCGADNRVPSSDNRVGRISGCTGWRITNGAMLTAGHCGPVSGVMEFNVPASDPNGTANMALPEDQYPIIPGSEISENLGLGDDWSLFRVNRNSNTGLRPHEAYGLPFRVTQVTMLAGATTRVTGFGIDSTPPGTTGGGNSANRTNQTATGPFVSTTVVDSNTAYVRYAVDITPATSGSPVIMESSGITIGINTNDGCNTLGNAQGCSFLAGDLAAAMDDFRGTNAVYVDAGHGLASPKTGTVFRPYSTFTQGLNAVPNGGVISMVAGTYDVSAVTITDSMLLECPTGGATIH
jgi:hypothetical protein